MEKDNTTYFWGYPGHAISAAKRDGFYYLFDPDHGLYSYTNSEEFRAAVVSKYSAQLNNASWWLFKVKPDPAEKGVSYSIGVS